MDNVFTDLLKTLHLMPRRSGSAFERFRRRCLTACSELSIANPAQIAYIFATVEHETNGTFKPVREAYWISEGALIRWLKRNNKAYVKGRWWGRGHTQNTWKYNYQRIDDHFELDGALMRDPDLLLRDFDLSVAVTVAAMKEGWYTGKSLQHYINKYRVDFTGARRIVNGSDRASTIASLSAKHLVLLGDYQSSQIRNIT